VSRVSEIFAQVKENHRKLAECDCHTFIDITPDKPLGKKYRCTACTGEVDSHAHYWYEKGRSMHDR
jgi:hypothetical protein